jgi:hypothetical protein
LFESHGWCIFTFEPWWKLFLFMFIFMFEHEP